MSARRTVLVLLSAAMVSAGAAAPAAAVGMGGGVTGVGAPRLLAPAGGAAEGNPNLSGTGRYVAYAVSFFDAQGSLHRRLARKDLQTGQVALLNLTPDGRVAGGNYGLDPVVSADGGRVSFTSNSSRLVATDGDTRFDAFVREVAAGVTRLVSGANGQVGTAALSDDGRHVVFTSSGTDLVAGSTGTNTDVYLRDLSTTPGAVVQVTVRPDGSPSQGVGAADADVDTDGGLVAFTSYARDLALGDGDNVDDGEVDLFLRDMAAGTTRWLGAQFPAGADPTGVVLSPDGRWISTRWADGSVHLTRTSTGLERVEIPNAQASRGAFSADGQLFAHTAAGKASIFDTTNEDTWSLRTPIGGSALNAAVSGDGLRAAYDWLPDDEGPVRTYVVDLTRAP